MEQTDVKMSTVVFNDGRIKCTSGSGVEIVFRIPRKSLAACKEREELRHGGIYFLFGERDGRQMIYVGHSVGGLFDKLRERDLTDKNFWTEALVFTTADNSFGARDLIRLEDKIFDDLKEKLQTMGGLVVKTDKEKKNDEIESCAEFVRDIFCTLGYKIFEPLTATPAPPKIETPAAQDDGEIFYLKQKVTRWGQKVDAKMKFISTKCYRVLAGSKICPSKYNNSPTPIKERRRSANVGTDNILLKDEDFSSSSAAAEFVTGNVSANGREVWKTVGGVMLKNFLGGNDLVH